MNIQNKNYSACAAAHSVFLPEPHFAEFYCMNITYPPYNPRIKKELGKEFIFDEIRKQWVRLTPEEWVRQNFLNYLIAVKQYPPSLIAVEKEIRVGEMKKRFDILVYKADKPWLIIECKEMNVLLNEQVLQQALNYNISLQTTFILITNGNQHFGFTIEDGEINRIGEVPSYV